MILVNEVKQKIKCVLLIMEMPIIDFGPRFITLNIVVWCVSDMLGTVFKLVWCVSDMLGTVFKLVWCVSDMLGTVFKLVWCVSDMLGTVFKLVWCVQI